MVVLALVLAATVVAPARADISCSTVYGSLMPCLQYVQEGGTPARGCCTGIRTLLSQANNTPDRRTICGCLKRVASAAPSGDDMTRATQLPSKCNVNLPYKISPSVNCNSYVPYTLTFYLYSRYCGVSVFDMHEPFVFVQDQLRCLLGCVSTSSIPPARS